MNPLQLSMAPIMYTIVNDVFGVQTSGAHWWAQQIISKQALPMMKDMFYALVGNMF